VIVSGLSAALAQTLVNEGTDLAALRSVGDLQGGIEAAEAVLALESYRTTPSSASRVRLRSMPPP
jgi:rsbT co-antagonist protein RsbR